MTRFHVLSLPLLASLACILQHCPSASAYQEGDFVAIARRGQFHEVAIPIPQPQGFKAVDTYKIQFSLAGDRLYTHWRKVVGGLVPVPMIQMTLTRVGNDIKSVRAEVRDVPEHYLGHHAGLVEEWHNRTHWPKHLLVDYQWEEAHEVNAVPGMYLLFATALVAALVVSVNALAAHSDKLREFVDEMAGEDTNAAPYTPESHIYGAPGPSHPAAWRPPVGPKGD